MVASSNYIELILRRKLESGQFATYSQPSYTMFKKVKNFGTIVYSLPEHPEEDNILTKVAGTTAIYEYRFKLINSEDATCNDGSATFQTKNMYVKEHHLETFFNPISLDEAYEILIKYPAEVGAADITIPMFPLDYTSELSEDENLNPRVMFKFAVGKSVGKVSNI